MCNCGYKLLCMGLNRPAITFTLKVLWKGWAQGFKIYEKITFALKDLWKGWVLGLKIFDVEVVGERTDSAILT